MPETKARLLVVDDDAAIRTPISHCLSEIGYRVRTAEDGFFALLEIEREAPDIRVSDLNMPRMSGFELLSIVRHRFPSIHTVAMSGTFYGDEVPDGVFADAFFQKGSSLGLLISKIESLSGQRRVDPRPTSVTVFCPKCLGTFSQVLTEAFLHVQEIVCVYCRSLIQFAQALSDDQDLLLPNQ